MTRVVSGLVLIALVLAVVWYAPAWVFLAVVSAFLVGGCLEYADLVAKTGLRIPKVASATAALVVAVTIGLQVSPVPAMAAVLVAVTVVMLGLNAPAPHVPGSAAAALFPSLYLGLPLGLLAVVRDARGPAAVLFVIFLVIVSDTAQFYVGSTFGRRRLAPAVSPKKSVEGALGGLVAAAVTSAVFGQVAWPALGPAWLAGLGLVLAALGIAGDLFESLLKRSADVKDSSNLIPGHGGILDRIDSLLLVVPGFFVFLYFLS